MRVATWEERAWKTARNHGFLSLFLDDACPLPSPPPPPHTHTQETIKHPTTETNVDRDDYFLIYIVPVKSFCILVLTVPWRPIFFLRGILAFLEFIVSLQQPGLATFLVFIATLKNSKKCKIYRICPATSVQDP